MAANLAIVISAQDASRKVFDDLIGRTDKLGMVGKATGLALGMLAVGVGAVAAGIGASVKVAADFEQALADVGSATGATKDDMAKMRKEALGIGKDTSKSASEAVRAMGELVRAGISTEAVIGGAARSVVQLAEATGSDVTEMATLTAKALNTFKKDGLDAADVANLVAKAANASAIGTSDIASSLAAVGPVAAQAGLSMEDFATAVGIMGNNALVGSDAGTSLKTMIMSLIAPAGEGKKALKELGLSFFDASGNTKDFRDFLGEMSNKLKGATEQQRSAALAAIFGSDAIRAANILLGEGTKGWDAFKDAMAGAPSIAEQSRVRISTLSGVMEQIKGTIETLAINIGSQFVPALTSVGGMALDGLNKLVDLDWSFISKGIEDITNAAKDMAAEALPKLGALWNLLTTTFSEAGLGGIAQLAAKAIGDATPTVLAQLGALKDGVLAWFTGTAWPVIQGQIEAWRVTFVNWVGPAWEDMKKNLGALWGGFKGWFDETTPKIWPQLMLWKDQFVGWVTEVWPGMSENLGKWWGTFYQWFQDTDTAITAETKKWEAAIGKWITDYVTGGQMGKDLDVFGNALADWLQKDGLNKFLQGIGSMFAVKKDVANTAGSAWGDAAGQAAGSEFGPAFGAEMSRQFQPGGALNKAFKEFVDSEVRGILRGLNTDLDNFLRFINSLPWNQPGAPGILPPSQPSNPFQNVPAFASGGIVTRPTLALVGEAGPEAIVPLGRRGAMAGNHYDFSGATFYGFASLDEVMVRIDDRNARRGRA